MTCALESFMSTLLQQRTSLPKDAAEVSIVCDNAKIQTKVNRRPRLAPLHSHSMPLSRWEEKEEPTIELNKRFSASDDLAISQERVSRWASITGLSVPPKGGRGGRVGRSMGQVRTSTFPLPNKSRRGSNELPPTLIKRLPSEEFFGIQNKPMLPQSLRKLPYHS